MEKTTYSLYVLKQCSQCGGKVIVFILLMLFMPKSLHVFIITRFQAEQTLNPNVKVLCS